MPFTQVRRYRTPLYGEYAGKQVQQLAMGNNGGSVGSLIPGYWHLYFPSLESKLIQEFGDSLLAIYMEVDTDPLFWDNWRVRVWVKPGYFEEVPERRFAQAAFPAVSIPVVIAVVALALGIIAASIAWTLTIVKVPGAIKGTAMAIGVAAVAAVALGGLILVTRAK